MAGLMLLAELRACILLISSYSKRQLEIIISESLYENFNLKNLIHHVCTFFWTCDVCKHNSMTADDIDLRPGF